LNGYESNCFLTNKKVKFEKEYHIGSKSNGDVDKSELIEAVTFCS
jgi:hypothetical protein